MKKQLLTLVSLIYLAGSTNAQVSFAPAVNYNVTSGANAVTTADIDGDGDMDAIAALSFSKVSVFMNNGNGTFATPTEYTVGSNPSSIVATDLNGDGNKDLVAAITYGQSVSVLLNNGNGTFAPVVNYPVSGSTLVSLTTEDFNSDGNKDLAVVSNGTNEIRVLLGNGDGSFGTAVGYTVGSSPRSVTSADFNGDGKKDLAVANSSSNNISVFLGNGNSTFATAINYSVGPSNHYPNTIVAADFNNDGHSDLATGNIISNNSTVLLGNGTGTFTIAGYFGVGTFPTAITASDLNGDGKKEIVTVNNNSNNASVLQGNGDGTFAATVNNTVGSYPYSVAAADFNGDGKMDLVSANNGSNNLSVLLNLTTFPGATLQFDGVNDRVNLGSSLNTILSNSNKITVEAWVKPSSNSGLGCIVGNYNTNIDEMQFVLRRDGANYGFYVDDGTGFVSVSSTDTVTVGAWQHVVGVWDGSILSIYVNGVLSGTGALSGSNMFISTNPIIIGANNISENFNGAIDEVRIWNRDLCHGEILNNMNGELPMPQTGLLSYYKFNQGIDAGANAAITSLVDNSGNAINGTLSGFTLSGSTSNWIAPGAVTTGNFAASFSNPNISISGSNEICSGLSTTLITTGSVLDTYNWTPTSTNSNFINVAPTTTTTYSVSGSLNGCPSDTASITITTNPLPQILANSGSLHICGNASATVGIVSNGTNDTYQWYYESIANPGSPYQIDGNDTEINYDTDTMTIQDVVTGQYDGYFVFCEVTNSLGCVAKSTNDSIWVHDLPTVSAIASDTTICANSLLTLTGSGAETYNWNNGVTDNTAFTINASNTYTVIGIDTNNCQDTATIEITVNEIPSIDLTSQNVSCNGNNDGSATANVSGGTPNYSYSWAPSGGTNSIASGLVAGIYSLTITDANNCAVNQTVTITEPAAIDNTTSITNLTITTNATGVTYQWIDCNNGNTAIAGETNQSFTATANGNYAVIVTQNGCSDTSACVAINNVGITENNFGEDLLIYPNPTNGELTIDLGANYHDVNLIVRNTLGQVIFRKSFNATKLLSFNLIGDPGVYLIEVGVADKQAIMRVIKK